MRASLHVGLAALLVLAPALCCCNIRLLIGCAFVSGAEPAACPSCPQHALPAPPALSYCNPAPAKPAQKSCCDAVAPETPSPVPAPAAPQPHPLAPDCKCLGERPDATPPEPAPTVDDPQPTGEWIPVAVLGGGAIPPEHLGLVGGLGPPEGAGVDAKFEALYSRHVMRC